MRPGRRAPLLSLAIGLVAVAAIASPAFGWANGPNDGNGY
jgi:hypothetical protein